MRKYKTYNEVKEHLPEILDRINCCKVMFDCSTIMLEGMQRFHVEEMQGSKKDYGWWTTLGAYSETFRNQMQYLAEIEYLQAMVKKVGAYPKI